MQLFKRWFGSVKLFYMKWCVFLIHPRRLARNRRPFRSVAFNRKKNLQLLPLKRSILLLPSPIWCSLLSQKNSVERLKVSYRLVRERLFIPTWWLCQVLHACAHNPTGVDPNEEQWQQIAEVCIAKNFFVIMDAAYLGFGNVIWCFFFQFDMLSFSSVEFVGA